MPKYLVVINNFLNEKTFPSEKHGFVTFKNGQIVEDYSVAKYFPEYFIALPEDRVHDIISEIEIQTEPTIIPEEIIVETPEVQEELIIETPEVQEELIVETPEVEKIEIKEIEISTEKPAKKVGKKASK